MKYRVEIKGTAFQMLDVEAASAAEAAAMVETALDDWWDREDLIGTSLGGPISAFVDPEPIG